MALLLTTSPATYSADVAVADELGNKSSDDMSGGSDTARKAEILSSPEWRRAVFELGHWLDTQSIYSGKQVAEIKSRFNARVAKMSAYEANYLLDDLQRKFRVMDTPEAIDARQWVGQYLSVLSETKRADFLKHLPDVTSMSASELEEEIRQIESTKERLASSQTAFDKSRQDLVRLQQQSIMAAQKSAASASRSGSYSPYRSGSPSGSKTPFSNVKTGGSVHVTAGPFGAYVSF